ncbi:MAG: primosomal protein N' [Clostridiaceae bacterium]|nr:primosomal protein N' [Clostridiaceae bacterium]
MKQFLITQKFIEVALIDSTVAFDNIYSYFPSDNKNHFLGQIVEVPFGRGNSIRKAVIVGQSNECEFEKIKKIKNIVTEEPIYLPDQIELAKEMRRRYLCTLGQAFKTISPPSIIKVGKKTGKACRLINKQLARDMLSEDAFTSLQQQRAVEMLLEVEYAFVNEITQACQISASVLKTLEKKEVVEFITKPIEREAEKYEIWDEPPVKKLNPDQIAAINGILELKGDKNNLKEALLYGVTGSGKTEIYLRLAKKMIQNNRSVIILVPEISLTPLMISRFISQFEDQVAIWHSRLTITQRFEQWQKIIKGEKKIVVGARSAIFSPLKNIGLIIIDEEQENSYVSESNPKYKAHEIARIRAIQHDATLVLGSATPSIDSYYRHKQNKNKLFILKERAKNVPLPKIELVSMKEEHSRSNYDNVFSKRLLEVLQETFANNKQAMLFINRRGLSSALQCIDCGEALKCPNCEVALTRHVNHYNKHSDRLICHYCGKIKPVITTCPACGGENMVFSGVGTQAVEQAFKTWFPNNKALRMDFDTVVGSNTHLKILNDFREKKADCLIGTQMIAKGHDFPDVQTVGILSVDSLLHTGSFSAEEKAFQLITQAAGRSGRQNMQGKVIIQGYDLEHYAVKNAAKQDFLGFYNTEIAFRKRAGFPPFQHIGQVLVQSISEKKAKNEIQIIYRNFYNYIHKNKDIFQPIFLFEAAPAPIFRLRKRYRYRIILKAFQKIELVNIFHMENKRAKPKGISVSFDIDSDYML